MKTWITKLEGLWVALALFGLACVYLQPATDVAFSGRSDLMMGNGGDSLTVPFQFHAVLDALKNHPSRLFYGALYSSQINAPEGFGLWIPWIDRLIVVLTAPFINLENGVWAYIAALMILNGLMFYAWGRIEGWPRPIAFALCTCFAINAYVRARGMIHPALAAIYYIPTLFLALRLIQSDRRKDWALASACLFFTVITAHYYVMILAAISPLLAWFLIRYARKKSGGGLRASLPILVRGGVIAMPAIFFLAWSVLRPIPGTLIQPHALRPTSAPEYGYFLVMYATRPIDYLAHDIGLGARDLNPIREWINQSIFENMSTTGQSNAWERTNGIRWSVLALGASALIAAYRSRRKTDAIESEFRWRVRYILGFGLFCYFASLSPRCIAPGGIGICPSIWVHTLMPDFRVPTRFGPLVQFSVLTLAGYALTRWWDQNPNSPWKFWIPAGLLVVFALDYSPLQKMPLVPTEQPITRAVLPNGKCGTGTYLPYLDGDGLYYDEFTLYRHFQRLRDTPCSITELGMASDKARQLSARFGKEAIKRYVGERRVSELAADLKRYADCSGLEWLYFDSDIPLSDRPTICGVLGWPMITTDLCRATESHPFKTDLSSCLN